MKYRAVCFDFDYTLADATDSIVAGFTNALGKMGWPIPERETIRATIGYYLKDAYTMLSGDASEEGRSQFDPLYQEAALPIQMAGIPLFPGAVELFKSLKEQGVRLAIVSSRRSISLLPTLEKQGLLEDFDLVIGGEEVKGHKPDPEGLLMAMDKLGVKKEEFLYCGDTVLDAGAAKNAGVDFAAVLNGTTPMREFMAWPCACIAKDLWGLKAWLEEN